MIAIPIIFIIIILIAQVKGVEIFTEFISGVKSGVITVFNIFPSLLGLIVAIGVFRASGALDLIITFFEPIASFLKIPKELVPLAILRPISGSASLAMVSDILKTQGVDSFIGKVAAVMMGTSETILYTLSIYLGSIGVKKIRYTLIVAILVEIMGIYVAVTCCRYFFCGYL